LKKSYIFFLLFLIWFFISLFFLFLKIKDEKNLLENKLGKRISDARYFSENNYYLYYEDKPVGHISSVFETGRNINYYLNLSVNINLDGKICNINSDVSFAADSNMNIIRVIGLFHLIDSHWKCIAHLKDNNISINITDSKYNNIKKEFKPAYQLKLMDPLYPFAQYDSIGIMKKDFIVPKVLSVYNPYEQKKIYFPVTLVENNIKFNGNKCIHCIVKIFNIPIDLYLLKDGKIFAINFLNKIKILLNNEEKAEAMGNITLVKKDILEKLAYITKFIL